MGLNFKRSILDLYHIYNNNNNNCRCSRTEDEVEELQHWCGNATGHGLEEEGHPRRGRDESKYSEAFQVGMRI